jgi:LysR family glycine cleavage system transcriptional activator
MQLLPHSLTAIRVFDAAARHLSCSRAADELFLTQSAVSKQLQSLEEYLGVSLFTRIHQGLVLTDGGKVYWEAVRPALLMLADATATVRSLQADNSTVSLGVPATLGQQWLIPRLADFNNANPDISVQFVPRLASDSSSAALTAEIRFGRGNWPGMHALYLLGREQHLVSSPTLLKRQPVKTAADMLKHRLMEHRQLPNLWERWFAGHSVSGYDPRRTQQFEQFSVMIPALIAGLGVGMMPRFLIDEELRRRQLTLVFKEALESDNGYYLVHPKERKPSAALERFAQWLLDEAAKTRR